MPRFLKSIRLLVIFTFTAAAFSCNAPPAFTEKQIQEDPDRFKEVRIGEQVWMVKNLNVVCFRNGDTIPEAKTESEWKLADSTKHAAWCYYENNIEYGKKYGKLYNYYAVTDPRELAPEGWHIPTYEEWQVLAETVQGKNPVTQNRWNTVGPKLKSKTDWWENGCGTNESGFTGLPAGSRNQRFATMSTLANWWCAEVNDPDGLFEKDGWGFRLIYNEVYITSFMDDKSSGNSVRCVKD